MTLFILGVQSVSSRRLLTTSEWFPYIEALASGYSTHFRKNFKRLSTIPKHIEKGTIMQRQRISNPFRTNCQSILKMKGKSCPKHRRSSSKSCLCVSNGMVSHGTYVLLQRPWTQMMYGSSNQTPSKDVEECRSKEMMHEGCYVEDLKDVTPQFEEYFRILQGVHIDNIVQCFKEDSCSSRLELSSARAII